MRVFLQAIQTQIATIPELKYVDEDWGQLDNYSPNPPTMFPFVLIDISALNFSNIGMDKTAIPITRQMAEGRITLTIANLKLTNTSGFAPQNQKDTAWHIWDIIENVHQKVQGFNPTEKSGGLIRTGLQRMVRDDGIQEYKVTYTIGLTNV